MSKVKCYDGHKTGLYARDRRSKGKGSGEQPRGDQFSKKQRRGRKGATRQATATFNDENSKGQGRISLSQAMFDEHKLWVGLMVDAKPSEVQ
jgi:hypothetical protein